MQHYSPHINVMIKAIRKASATLVRDFNEIENLQSARKSACDFAEKSVHKATSILIYELENSRPDYGFLFSSGEEIQGNDPSYRWIINPLDGFRNFYHAIPHFCISLALEKTTQGKSEIVSSVIEAPIMREFFWAEKGSGAWNEKAHESVLSQTRMRVSTRGKLTEILACASMNTDHLPFYHKLIAKKINIVDFGSTALSLAYLAAGRIDSYFQLQESYCNVAAGTLLTKEAGSYTTNWQNHEQYDPIGALVISNNNYHKEMLVFLNG
jgi:myo-inositol-1(or 4)-monophosphatase